MRRPEVTSGQQSRVKKEAEEDSHTTRLDKGQKKSRNQQQPQGKCRRRLASYTRWRLYKIKRLAVSGLQGQMAEKNTTLSHHFFSRYSSYSWPEHWNFRKPSQVTRTSVLFRPFLIKNKKPPNPPNTHTQSSFTVLEGAATFGGIKARQNIYFDYIKAPLSVFAIPAERCCVVMD